MLYQDTLDKNKYIVKNRKKQRLGIFLYFFCFFCVNNFYGKKKIMATLCINGVHEHMVSTYEAASEEEKQQVKKVFEEILCLWASQGIEARERERLRQKAIDFAMHHKTFPLNWKQHRLTREELNER
jgi:hypothetical protein